MAPQNTLSHLLPNKGYLASAVMAYQVKGLPIRLRSRTLRLTYAFLRTFPSPPISSGDFLSERNKLWPLFMAGGRLTTFFRSTYFISYKTAIGSRFASATSTIAWPDPGVVHWSLANVGCKKRATFGVMTPTALRSTVFLTMDGPA